MGWDEIKAQVEEGGGVCTVAMETLRNANGAEKLGVHVREAIVSTLAGMGLGHVPRELPSYQHESVRLYKRGTPVGDLIDKVLAPGQQNDETIVAKLGGQVPDYAAIVQKIEELVAD
jgi:hypothetical protein